MFVESWRGSIVESRHRVHIAVVDAAGRLVARAGAPALAPFWRPGANPFRAFPLAVDGPADRCGLGPEELAIACASHSSEPRRVELGRAFLKKVGGSERDLLCGPHPPLSE